MKVSQLMCPIIITCRAEDSLESAARKMWDHDIGCLPVVDDDKHVIGMLTDRDVSMSAYLQGRPLKDIQVHSAMARTVFSAPVTDSVEDVEGIMRKHRVLRVPIIDQDNRLVGLISTNELAREAARSAKLKHPDVAGDEFVSTLASICHPRSTGSVFPAAAE